MLRYYILFVILLATVNPCAAAAREDADTQMALRKEEILRILLPLATKEGLQAVPMKPSLVRDTTISRRELLTPVNGLGSFGFGSRVDRLGQVGGNFKFVGQKPVDITAIENGKVIYAGWYGGYERIVIVSHDSFGVAYTHVSKAFGQANGRVEKGQVIARYSGSKDLGVYISFPETGRSRNVQ